jgi:amino acid adenylation domain-containing protein
VALIFQRRAPLVASILGVLKAGAIYLPVDPTFPAARVGYLLKDAEAGLVLCDDKTHALARDLVATGWPLANVDALADAPAPPPALPAVGPDTLASLFYTSGSTGEPKGVLQTHRNLLQYARNYVQTLRIRPADRVSLLFSYSFSGSIPDIFGTLLCGATLCPFDVKRRGPAALARWVRENEITLLHLVPTLFRHLASHVGEGEEFPALRAVDLGGEAAYAADVAACRRHFSRDCVLVHRLAATEASLITQHRVDRETPVSDGALPVGRPVDGMEIRIEGSGGEELAPGEVGEIVLRSRFLSPGYWRRPALTARAFRSDPEVEGVRLYRIGDRGRLGADGVLEHLGRRNQRVKIRGFTVEIAEVEGAVRAIPGVRECAVTTRSEPGGDAMLVAFVLPRPDAALSESELRQSLLNSLPEYTVPARIHLVLELPLTATGKVDRKRLMAAELPESSVAKEPLPPRNATESELASIWQKALGIDALGVRDDYFALGGTSLQAVSIMSQIEEQFGRDLVPSVLFRAPTIERLARLLERDDLGDGGSLAVALRADGSGPPLFCFPGNGGEPIVFKELIRHLGGDHPCYGVQMPGLVGRQPPPRSIKDYVRPQLAAIREIQPRGPYFLTGYSFGCTVAFEIAQRLRAKGEHVALLALIDGWAPGHPRLLHASHLHRALDHWLGPYLLERERVSSWSLIYHTLKMRGRSLESFLRELRGRPLTRKQRRQRRKRASIRARARHHPTPYAGPVVLIRLPRKVNDTLFDDDPLRGWGAFTTGTIGVRVVPGVHKYLLKAPWVSAIADEIADAMSAARKN